MLDKQRAYLRSGATRPIDFRLRQLRRLYDAIQRHEGEVAAALRADLGKSAGESYMTETGMVLAEISHNLRHLHRWARPKKVGSPLSQFPAASQILREPYGVCLIIAPWNYPFQLALLPLVSAIAAGNCATVKPSELAPQTALVIEKILAECFPPHYCQVVQGGAEVAQRELAKPYDLVFFTGGERVGKLVMHAAAEHLTPVVLELGGKSPCIVDETADLSLAARRIAWGKLLNAGQTCIAPDYLLVQQRVKEPLIAALQREFCRLAGAHPLENPDYPRIVSRRHFERLTGLIEPDKIRFGGQSDPAALRIAPTLLDSPSPDSPVMQEEIFGPLLPILPYARLEEAIGFILDRPKPLALYLFTRSGKTRDRVLEEIPFGGGCVNDTISHIASSTLPFGGVGASGMGRYHGEYGFQTFSHEKAVMEKSCRLDLPMRYPPYGRWLPLVRRILK